MAVSKITNNEKISKNESVEIYSFPVKASDVSDGNDEYIAEHSGNAMFIGRFANTKYSQINMLLNGINVTANICTSNENADGLPFSYCFHINKGDKVKVLFYNEYAVKSAFLKIFY